MGGARKGGEPAEAGDVFARLIATVAAREAVEAKKLATAAAGSDPVSPAKADSAGEFNLSEVYNRLVRAFGWGDFPTKRKEFYVNLMRCLNEKGSVVMRAIEEAAAQSVGCAAKDRYFCRAVVSKLREQGISVSPPKARDPGW
jgi:hypothetical protein